MACFAGTFRLWTSSLSLPISSGYQESEGAVKRRIKTVTIWVLLLLGYTAVIALPFQDRDLDIRGIYGSSLNPSSNLEIQAEGSHYVALLSGGSVETAGTAASADCYIRAIGKLEGRVLTATFAPVETETFAYNIAQAEKEKRQLKIVFEVNTANVVHADTLGYCGLATDFIGHYSRKQ